VRHGLRRGLRHRLLVSGGVIQELVTTLGLSIALWARGAEGHDPDCWGYGSRRFGWPLSQGLRRGSHPVVGRIVQAPCRAVSGRWVPYRLSPP
jgi:hypothetical protein